MNILTLEDRQSKPTLYEDMEHCCMCDRAFIDIEHTGVCDDCQEDLTTQIMEGANVCHSLRG